MEKYNVTRNCGCLFWVFVARNYSYRLLYSNKQTLCSAFACTRFKIGFKKVSNCSYRRYYISYETETTLTSYLLILALKTVIG